MDVDDVEAQHHYVRLLLRAEEEMVAADQHLEDVEAGAHPARVVSGAQPLCHLQSLDVADEKLKMARKIILITQVMPRIIQRASKYYCVLIC